MTIRNEDGSRACICHEHKPECDCVPLAASLIQFAAEGAPPLVPDLPTFLPNPEQERFIWLHERHLVVKWIWKWQGYRLQAFTDRNLTATISKDNVNELVAEGFMRWGLGQSIYLNKEAVT